MREPGGRFAPPRRWLLTATGHEQGEDSEGQDARTRWTIRSAEALAPDRYWS